MRVYLLAFLAATVVSFPADEAGPTGSEEPADAAAEPPEADTASEELSRHFEVTETTARVIDYVHNEEYEAPVLIFEPKAEVPPDEDAPYVVRGAPPKPSVSFIIGHPDLSVDSKRMTIFVNAPPESLPEELRRIYFAGRMETEPTVVETPEHMDGLTRP